MGIDLPDPLRWLFKLTGSDWPDADEDKIAAFGEGIGNMRTKILNVGQGITESVRAANLSSSGPAMTLFTDNMRDVVNNGLPGMSESALAMAEEIHGAALQAEYSKGTAVINMAIMAPMIVEAIAAAPETFGATMAVAEAGIAAVRTTVPKLLMQMVEKVVTNTAMMEAGDLAVQGYQILIKRDRASFDGRLALNTVEMGAIGGAFDGLLTGGLQKFAPKFFKTAEAGIQDANKLIWAPPKWVNMGSQALNNTFTSLTMAGINHEPIDGKSLLEGAGLGMLFGGLARTGGGVKIKPFNDFHMNETFHNGDTWIRPNASYLTDKTGTSDFSFNVRRRPGSGDGTRNVYYGDPHVAHPEGTPPLSERLGPVIDKVLEEHPEGSPKPNIVVLEHTPAADLDGIRALAEDKGVSIVVPDGRVETGPNGSIRVPGPDGSEGSGGSGGGTGFREIRPDGTEEHLGPVYDPRRTVGEPVTGGVPPSAQVLLGTGGQKFASREILGEGDCTVSALADSALSQGISKKTLHADGLDLSHAGDMREYRNRLADAVAARSTDTRSGSPVLLGELGSKGAHDLLDKLDRLTPPKASSSSHIDALDLAVPQRAGREDLRETPTRTPLSEEFRRPVKDPVAELTKRLEQDPERVLSALEDHYNAAGDKGMAQLTAYAKAKAADGGSLPQHRDLLDYAIRERTLAETPLGGEMLQAVAHTLGLDVVVVSADKGAFHLNGDAAKQVLIHRVDSGDGRNHYRSLRPETEPSSKVGSRAPRPLPGDPPKPRRRVPVSSRGGHGALHRPADGTAGNALHRLAGGARTRTNTPPERRGGWLTTPRPENPRPPEADVRDLMQQSGRPHGAPPPQPDGFEHVSGHDVMNVRAVPPTPGFLTGLHFDHLQTERAADFFDAVDLARPDNSPPRVDHLFTPRTTQPPTTIPRVLHSIWLGGPLHRGSQSRAKFMDVMGANAEALRGNGGHSDFTSVLWTDVPRHEIQQVRALDPNAVHTPRLRQVREMLDWAEQHGIKLANVDEIFSGTQKAELHNEIATERARTTGPGYAGASDLLRVEILHRFGGVYSDGDNNVRPELAQRVAEVEQDAAKHRFAISHSLTGQTNNSAFISTPHNDVVHLYRENLRARYPLTVREIFADKSARGNADALKDIVGTYDPHRFFNLDARGEVIGRTGPAGWHFDAIARTVSGDDHVYNSWFAGIGRDHIVANSDHSWLPSAATHVAEHTPPADAVKAAVVTLHREAVNRDGVLHLPSVADIVGKVAEGDRDRVWQAVLHTMDETWPPGRPPDIVLAGQFTMAGGRAEHRSVPTSAKDYLHDSGLFQGAVFHTAAGAPVDRVERRYLPEDVANELRRADDARLQDLGTVHKLIYGNANLLHLEQVRDSGAILDLLHGSLGGHHDGPGVLADALRDLTRRRFGGDGDFSVDHHLKSLVEESRQLALRGDFSPEAQRRQTEYSRVAEGADPTKIAAEVSSEPLKGRLSAKKVAERWDRAVDTLSLEREIVRDSGEELTPQQRRGLWKTVRLYRQETRLATSDRPLTLDDLRDFRAYLRGRDPLLGAGDAPPHEWLRTVSEHMNAASPETGRVHIGDLLREANRDGHSWLSASFQSFSSMVSTRSRVPSSAPGEGSFAPHHFPEPLDTRKQWRADSDEALRQFDELGSITGRLPPRQFRELLHHAGQATDADHHQALLKQMHTNIAHLEPESLRTAVQGSRFHRNLSDQVRRHGPDAQVEKYDLPAFSHSGETERFRRDYVETREDGSGMWIRDPHSELDTRNRPWATTMRSDPGHFSVAVHGSPDKVYVGRSELSAHDLANLLRQTPEWADDPRPIRLIACNTGEHDEGFAQQLADLLGVEVKAPNTVVWAGAGGKPYASSMIRHADGTMRPAPATDGAFRVFSPRTIDTDGTAHRDPVRLDTEYEHLGRTPALTVLSRALAGPFGDAIGGHDPVARKIIDDWRQVMRHESGDTEQAYRNSQTARDALDKVLTPDTLQWLSHYAPPGSEVNQALHILAASKSHESRGGESQSHESTGRDQRGGTDLERESETRDSGSMPFVRDTGFRLDSATMLKERFGPDATATPERLAKLRAEYDALRSLGPVDERAWRRHLEYRRTGDRPVSELIESPHPDARSVDDAARELTDRMRARSSAAHRPPPAQATRTLIDVLTVAEDLGFKPRFSGSDEHAIHLNALWKTVETHREVLPGHSRRLERPIRYQDLEHLGRQLGLRREGDESRLEFVHRLHSDIESFRTEHPRTPLSGSAMARHLAERDGAGHDASHEGTRDGTRTGTHDGTRETRRDQPEPSRLPPRSSLSDDEALSLAKELDGHVPVEAVKKLAVVNLVKFPDLGQDPRRKPLLSDFTDLVHQLLGPDHDVRSGTSTLAAAATRARKDGSLHALDAALHHDPGDFRRAPWYRQRYEVSTPWKDRHAIERDAALLYFRAFGEHVPVDPDPATIRNMRRALQVAKLAHASYDRRGQADPEAFYRDLGSRLRPRRDETGAPSDPFRRLLRAAGRGDGRYQNPDFLAQPMRDRLHGGSVPRPPLGHDVPAEELRQARELTTKLPGLFTATGFGGHEHIESRLRGLIPGRGPLRFEVGLETELREGFGAMVDGGLPLRVRRDGRAFDVQLKALLKRGPEEVPESGGTARNETRSFRTGGDGGGAHGTSRTVTVDAGLKTGYGPGSLSGNVGTSRIRSREVTSSESFGGDIYLDPTDGTHRHTVEAEVHIEVSEVATGHWVQDAPRADDPPHTVELRMQDHLTATEGFDAAPHAVTKQLDDTSIDLLLGERTGYGDPLKRDFFQLLHDRGLTLDEKARTIVDGYFRDVASPHNVAALHSADPYRRAGLTTSVTAADQDGKRVVIGLGAHAEAKTLSQVSAKRAGLKMDQVDRHTVRQGISTGKGGGLPSSLTGSVKAPDGTTGSLGLTGNSTRTETSSLESAYSVSRSLRAEDESASYRLVSKVDLHVAVGSEEHRTLSTAEAPAWLRLRTADRDRLVAAAGEDGPHRPPAEGDAARLDPRLVTSDGLPLGQVKQISNLGGLYRDLVGNLGAHLPEEAARDLSKLFEEDPTGSFLHGDDDAHENWRRIVATLSGPTLGQRADALTGEGVAVRLRIGGKEVPLRISLHELNVADATPLGTDEKRTPISFHQASQTSRLRSTRQLDLGVDGSVGVGTGNGLFKGALTGRETKGARSTESGGVRQYTRSFGGSVLFDVKGRLHWRLEDPAHPAHGSVEGGAHLWMYTDLVKATSALGELPPIRPLEARDHSPLLMTPVHMAVNGGGMDKLRAELAKRDAELAQDFGSGRFAAQLPLLTGGGVRVRPGVHWDVTPVGRPQVLKKIDLYVEAHSDAGSMVDHDVETRSGKGGSAFGGGSGSSVTGGATVSHARDTSQGSNTGHGESGSRLMTAKKVPMALVRTEVRHRVDGVRGPDGAIGRPVEVVGETLVLVPLSELHHRREQFDFPADDADRVFEGFQTPGEGTPSPALRAGMMFGPIGAHPDGGLGLEAALKAEQAFGDKDLGEQVRDLLQTPTLSSQLRKLSDGGLTHPIVTESGGRYELRVAAKPIGSPVLHDTNVTGGAKMYNAESRTSNERGGRSQTTTGSATFGFDNPVVTATVTHAQSATHGDVETRARRDVESEGMRFSGETVDEYRQDVEYSYTITQISHPLWNLHFGDRPPEVMRRSVDGSYVSEVRVFEPRTLALEVDERNGEPGRELTREPGRLAENAVVLDWHGQEKVAELFREFGGRQERHAPPDGEEVRIFSKGSFTRALGDVLKPGGTEFRGVDLGGRTLTVQRGVVVEGKALAPKSVAYLKAGAERESFSHREVATTTEHADGSKRDTKGQVAVTGTTPHGVKVGGRVGVAHASEVRDRESRTQSAETRPRWDKQPGALYAVHVPVELRLDFGRGAAKHSVVDVLVHVDEAGARELGVSEAELRRVRGEVEVEVEVEAKPEPEVEAKPEPEPEVETKPEPEVEAKPEPEDKTESQPRPAPETRLTPEPTRPEPEPVQPQPEPAPIVMPPLDEATRQSLAALSHTDLAQLENLVRAGTAEHFQNLRLRAALTPGHEDTRLLEQVPGLISRDHALQAIQEYRATLLHVGPPTEHSVTALVTPFAAQHPGVGVRVIPAGTTFYRMVDIRTAIAYQNGHIEARNRPGWMQLGHGVYTSPNRGSAGVYRDQPDKVMLRLTLTRDMVGMDVEHAGGNVEAIGHELGERNGNDAQVTDAGARLLAGSDFVSARHAGAEPYEVKFHEGAFGDFAVTPDHGFREVGDGAVALYGDWAARPADLPQRASEVLARIGQELRPQLLWHQVTADHVRAAANARGLPADRIAELHDRILAEPGSIVQPHTVEWGATMKHGADGSVVTDVDNRYVVKVPTEDGTGALHNEASALQELHALRLPGAKIVDLLHVGPAEVPVRRGEGEATTVVGPVVVLRKADGALNDPGYLAGLTSRERLKLAVDLIDTVQAMHGAGWTHGDIGLKNTLHDTLDPSGIRAVVADFGNAERGGDPMRVPQDQRDLFKTVYNVLSGDHRDNWLTATGHLRLEGAAEAFFQGRRGDAEHLTPGELRAELQRLYPEHFQGSEVRRGQEALVGVVGRGDFGDHHRLSPEIISTLPITQRFARGAMGEVFRTEHAGREYAMKRPTPEGLEDFRAEVDAMLHIDDRYPDGDFAKYRGHVDDDSTGHHRLLLDLADTSVQKLLDDDVLDRVPMNERARMARDVIRAARDMRAMDLSHNDINPKNVLVAGAGDQRRAMLADFGSTGPTRLSDADVERAFAAKVAELGMSVELVREFGMEDEILQGIRQDRGETDRVSVIETVEQILGLNGLDRSMTFDELEAHLRAELPGIYPEAAPLAARHEAFGGTHDGAHGGREPFAEDDPLFTTPEGMATFVERNVKTFEGKPNHLLIRDPGHPRVGELEATSRALPEEAGYFTVDAHGGIDGVHLGARRLSVEQLARLIEADPGWQRTRLPVRLASCDTGRDAEGFAQQLARRLGVEVKAPTDKLWVSHRGDTFVTRHRYAEDGTVQPVREISGSWQIFSPEAAEMNVAPRVDTADLHAGDGIDEVAMETLRSFSEDDLARLEHLGGTMTVEEIQRIGRVGRQAVLLGIEDPDVELLSRVPVGLSLEKAVRAARAAQAAFGTKERGVYS